jgi:hypothetical protein
MRRTKAPVLSVQGSVQGISLFSLYVQSVQSVQSSTKEREKENHKPYREGLNSLNALNAPFSGRNSQNGLNGALHTPCTVPGTTCAFRPCDEVARCCLVGGCVHQRFRPDRRPA